MSQATDIDPNNWPAVLAAETAMGYYTPDELFLRCGQPRELYEMVTRSNEFKTAVTAYKRELHEGPNPLRMKAKRMLWETMEALKHIASDSEVAPGDRIAAIREIAKLSGDGGEAPAATATAVVQIVRFGSDGNRNVVAVQ